MTVNLDQPEWNQILAILSQAPWNVANPLLMKIGEQLRTQGAGTVARRPNGPDLDAEGGYEPEARQRAS